MPDSTLYLYTSLTAGSSHIVTATARLETILKANKLAFRVIDVATDDTARKLWGRRASGKKLPGLVKYGTVVGDLEQIEEWNEYGELRMTINSVEDFDSIPATDNPTTTTTTTKPAAPTESAPPKQSTIKIQNPPAKETQKDDSISAAMKQASEEAASKAKENKTQPARSEPAAEPATEDKKGESVRRQSIAAEIAEQDGRRPPLAVPEQAAVSSANIRADFAEALGLVEHHRGSIVSATSKEERDAVAQDLRKSISGGQQDILNELRDANAEKGGPAETIEEDPFEGDEQAEKETGKGQENQKKRIFEI